MENMKKNTVITGEAEMNQRMLDRVEFIETETYWYLIQLLELNMAEAERKVPWNDEILREVFKDTVTILNKYGTVCVIRTYPHRKSAGSTAAHFPSAGARDVTVRMK